MPKFVKAGFTAKIRIIRGNSTAVREDVQEALIEAVYYCLKDSGTTEPLNQILDAVGSGTRVAGLLRWVEDNAPVHVLKGKFALSKAAYKEYDVNSEEDFAPIEAELRAKPHWYASVEPEVRASKWDTDGFLKNLLNDITTKGKKASANDSDLDELMSSLATLVAVRITKREDALAKAKEIADLAAKLEDDEEIVITSNVVELKAA